MIEQAKGLYECWNFEAVADDIENSEDREAVKGLVAMYLRLIGEVERLNIARYTHESYDKTVSELHEENMELRKALEYYANKGDVLGFIARQALGKE